MRSMKSLPTIGFVLLAALAAPVQATAQAPEKSVEAVESVAQDGRVTLQIENHHWQDVRVYVISGSLARRIGTVTGLTTENFKLPRDLNVTVHDVQIAISPIGMRGVHYSPRVVLSPGDHIQYRVANNLALSTLSIF